MRIRLFCCSFLLSLACVGDAAAIGIPPAPNMQAAPATISIPSPPAWLPALDRLYDSRIRVAGLEERKFTPEHWWQITTPLLSAERGFQVNNIAASAEGRPLRHVAWGDGPKRVLLWSQMHGDESTASMALADLLRFLAEHPEHSLVQRLRQETALHFLPIVNPDGATRFQRHNAQGIDINRDARALVSSEARALQGLRDRLRPQFGFNLHDQQVGYRAGDSIRGTAIALLAPAYDQARQVNATRARAIEVSAVIRTVLEPYISGHIARWDDTFNPRAFGDLTAQAGVSTILIESGGIEGDVHKQRLRKLNFLALVAALDSIATGGHAGMSQALYTTLPENGAVWPDLRITGATLAIPGRPLARADVLIDFEQPLLERGATIAEVGDLGDTPARRVIDASGLYLVPIQAPNTTAASRGHDQPFLPGSPAYFHLSRDQHGRSIVWTLARDVDPARPGPTRND